ncbi:MAG: hypothetical protein QF535_01315 [Anaerolineales bacterium]|nr:hypothetical protein [Anaerolineales bacterium]
MSKIKIYDGVVIDMGTSEVLELGESRYVDSSEVAYCGGGGGGKPGTTDTVSGFADPYKSKYDAAINTGQGLYDQGKLGQIVGFTPAQLAAQQAGMGSAGIQTGLEQSMANQALAPVDLTGMRTAAQLEAQQALGMNAANAGRAGGLGGSRQYLNNQSVANDLAAKFAQIDMQKQQLGFGMKGQALGAQGAGAETLAAIGQQQQQQAQNVADAPYAGISQLSNIYGGFMPKQTSVISKQGGGK